MRRRSLQTILLATSLGACGPLPHPFEHEGTNPLLEDRRAMAPVTVLAVPQLPGLAERMAKALADQEIAATTDAGIGGGLTLKGDLDGDILVWRILSHGGQSMGEVRQPLPSGPWNEVAAMTLADRNAPAVARQLRGDDSGLADLEARPRVALRPVKVPATIDGDSLTHAMAQALARHDLTVQDDDAVAVVEGNLRVQPGTDGQDLVQIDWIVRDMAGRDLGTVSQGSPVEHQRMAGNLGALGRDIAEAGAEGVAEVIHKRIPPH